MKVVNLVSAAIMVLAVGCGTQQSADPSPQASSSSMTSAPAAPTPPPTVSQFDARWMGLVPNQPQGWEELKRRITGEFQQFNLRPIDETETMDPCNGCASWTVDLTAYAPGKFDPTAARTDQPVSVNAHGDGFLREEPERHAATLTWQYADNAWATVRGMTSATNKPDRMVELARALKPAERTPVRLPMSVPNVPANMPLAEINIDKGRYGTKIDFAPCGLTANSGAGDCFAADTDRLSVQIRPEDYRTPTGGLEHETVPLTVGGKAGLYDERSHEAVVQVQPGMLATGLNLSSVAAVTGAPAATLMD